MKSYKTLDVKLIETRIVVFVFRQTFGAPGHEPVDTLRGAQDAGLRRADVARVANSDRRPLPRQEHVPQLHARGRRASGDRNVPGKGPD